MKKSSKQRTEGVGKWVIPILPPLVTGLLGIVSTLLVTGHLFPRAAQGTTEPGGTLTKNPPVLEAPYIYFSAKPADISLTDCIGKANASLDSAGFTGRETRQYFAWGYRGSTTGMVWCNTDSKLVVYVAAGSDDQETAKQQDALRRSF